jgi:DNA polymerase III delta subunit
MRLNAPQVKSHLAKQTLPFYIVSGEEVLLKQEMLSNIRKALHKSGFSEYIRMGVANAEDAGQCYNLLHTSSLLGDKKLI